MNKAIPRLPGGSGRAWSMPAAGGLVDLLVIMYHI
jgi:hypothetical protein